MTDPTAIRDRLGLRYPALVSYLDTESLIAQLQRDLADAEALASLQKPGYIAALRAEIARLEGTPDSMPTPKKEFPCACGRAFDKKAEWRGHQRGCPARRKADPPSYICDCGEVLPSARALTLHRKDCTPEPIVREFVPGFSVNSEGEYQCNCGRPFTQDMHDPAGRCIKCTKENP